jgi:hypothetical protein
MCEVDTRVLTPRSTHSHVDLDAALNVPDDPLGTVRALIASWARFPTDPVGFHAEMAIMAASGSATRTVRRQADTDSRRRPR